MQFIETEKGIWIPEGTKLEGHAPKTRNYALLAGLDVEGVITLDCLVSLPPTHPKLSAGCSLLDRIDFVEEIIASLSSNAQIQFTADDYLVRSALTFEDTVATRAAGIGDSARFGTRMNLDEKKSLLSHILDYEHHQTIQAYTKKHGIPSFSESYWISF